MTNYRDGKRNSIKLASRVVITLGALVAVNAQGYGVPATNTDAVKLMGMALHDVDNSQGVDGSTAVMVGRNQQYLLKCDTDKSITQADIGKTALLTASHTVVTTGDNLLSVGEIMGVEPDGYVWVEIGFGNTISHKSSDTPPAPVPMPIPSGKSNIDFNHLENCVYVNGQLQFTDGTLQNSEKGYQAITNKIPSNGIELFRPAGPFSIFIGYSENVFDYKNGTAKGVLLDFVAGNYENFDMLVVGRQKTINMSNPVGETIRISRYDNRIVFECGYNGGNIITDDMITDAPYFGIVMFNTNNLPISAIEVL
ncbi:MULTISPECIES: hypothetical protein [unclassified Moraxella]|uniref:hypothetical protein n=1 Tax=unclassified Moraxella TaxID=2685852 RepID=UPI003AF6C813